MNNSLYILCPLIFIAGFLDGSVGGGGLISVPAYIITGIPVHIAYGTNKLVNGVGMMFSAIKYILTMYHLAPDITGGNSGFDRFANRRQAGNINQRGILLLGFGVLIANDNTFGNIEQKVFL